MGFLSGGIACTRFRIVSLPEPPNFEAAAFYAIQPGSNLLESAGFMSFELDEPYEFGHGKFAFRVRHDKISVDGTAVKERLRSLIKAEVDEGRTVGAKRKKKLRELAQEEVLAQSVPRSKILEAVIAGNKLYVGSTSKGHLGLILGLLQKIGVEVEYDTPWLNLNIEEEPSEIVEPKDPGQSIWGCRFFKALLEEEEFLVEPEKGTIKLATASHAKVTLSGEVLGELDAYIEEGAELLAGKILFGEMPLTFDGLAYRINAIKLEGVKGDHWSEVLDERIEMLEGVWQTLDEKFAKFYENYAASSHDLNPASA